MQIFMIGICGTAMGNLAVLLNSKGHSITGSDENIFPPMSDFLKENQINIIPGYTDTVPENIDLVIIGNAISRGNNQAEQVLREKIPFMSMPEAIGKFILEGTRNIVVTGTHGKTTTTSMIVSILREGGLDPGFLIGGIATDLRTGGHIGKDPIFVIEGDEYDSAFFDKRSKFVHYSPDILVINNIEYDHSDIFEDLEGIKASFRQVINIVPDNGVILANKDNQSVYELSLRAHCPVKYFGTDKNTDFHLEITDDALPLRIKVNEDRYEVKSVWGMHNAYNSAATVAAAIELGIDSKYIKKGLANYKGVQRRMQHLGVLENGANFFQDFAHHPTAIKLTLAAFKKAFPGKRIVAVVEPRSNTMVRQFLQEEIIEALSHADLVYLSDLYRKEKIPSDQQLDRPAILKRLYEINKEVSHADNSEDIFNELMEKSHPGDIVVIMTNGSFGGLINRISSGLNTE